MATNWFVASNPVPQIWCYWQGEYLIQDAISIQDYPQTARSRQSNNGALPVTLLWYPKLRDSIGASDPLWAVGNASLVPGEVPSRRSTVMIMT